MADKEFNLLDEPWIVVMTDDKGSVKEVSIKELFAHAYEYKQLAGETPTQDFAVLRLLLAILHTVFSRFDASGNKHEWVELDDNYKQLNLVDEHDYEDELFQTWEDLWTAKAFPNIVTRYLEKWRDRFYLFGGEYPFYQVTEKTLSLAENKINKATPNQVHGKMINRVLSESDNKKLLFPSQGESLKNKLSNSEIGRWLVLYQGVTGTGDKVKFANQDKGQLSKGWLYDLGGVYVSGDNLFETLLLNLALVHPDTEYTTMQRPLWEQDSNEKMLAYERKGRTPDNLAELYTTWSRAITIPDGYKESEDFCISVIKLPNINHQNNFLELMTEWKFNKQGDNKDTFTPRKHQPEEQFWRSFGITFTPNSDQQHRPGVIGWISSLEDHDQTFRHLQFNAVGMESDGNATSWNPVNEVFDEVRFGTLLTDEVDGWIGRISAAVDLTKTVIDYVLSTLANDIKTVRNSNSFDFASRIRQEAYYQVDLPFRDWLASIRQNEDKDIKISEWRKTLRPIIEHEAQRLVASTGSRDFTGITVDSKGKPDPVGYVKNIFTVYNRFISQLNKYLPKNDLPKDKESLDK
jgi:CRISPR system Cascade subunit CasA